MFKTKQEKKKKTATKAWHDLCNGKSRRYAQQRRLCKQLLLLQVAVLYNVRWNILKLLLMPAIALDHTTAHTHTLSPGSTFVWACEVRWMRSLICLARWPLCLFVISDSDLDLDWVRGCCCCSGALFQLLFPCACLPTPHTDTDTDTKADTVENDTLWLCLGSLWPPTTATLCQVNTTTLACPTTPSPLPILSTPRCLRYLSAWQHLN